MVDNFFGRKPSRVAFLHAKTFVPGIDFTNDPLLQGPQTFSDLDTQLKRLGGPPNFHTTCRLNAPKCPFHHFQQDGHMALSKIRKGRVNYEPNSLGAAGPREKRRRSGFRSVLEKVERREAEGSFRAVC